MKNRDLKKTISSVITIEKDAIQDLLNKNFDDLIKFAKTISQLNGKVIVIGMGKSGLIGSKIAATLASTGTPSFFLHPGEAFHGDLGMVGKGDTVLLISYSGETEEVLKLLPFFHKKKIPTASITSKKDSTLGKNTDFYIDGSVEKEACPLNLAPTSSTTVALVIGDILSAILVKLKGFKKKDFAEFHPGGSLGKKLLTPVKSIMQTEKLPIISPNASIWDIEKTISNSRFGLGIIIKNDGKIEGVITDGDIRRNLSLIKGNSIEKDKSFALDIATKNPKTIKENASLLDAEEIMMENKINSLLVVNNEEKFSGIIQIYDI